MGNHDLDLDSPKWKKLCIHTVMLYNKSSLNERDAFQYKAFII